MFSFFKRSSKDKSKKDAQQQQQQQPQQQQQLKETDNMCKNILQQGKTTSPSVATEFGQRENLTNATTFISEVTALSSEKNDTKPAPEYPIMMMNSAKREPQKSGVKPCGHGTVAIAPHLPHNLTKREETTPPSSPQDTNKQPPKFNEKIEDEKDTITASMKLHINLPTITVSEPDTLINGNHEGGKKNLINQEAKFQSQLNDLSKQLAVRDAEANKLHFQMEELQRDVFAKSAGMERLQAELQAAYKESDIIKSRIRNLESDLADFRHKNNELNEELTKKTENFEEMENQAKERIMKLENLVKELREKVADLENQLKLMKEEKEKLEQQHAALMAERDEERKKLAESNEENLKTKEELDKKWKIDFEKLRTINIMKEQQLLDDFEWKLREVQMSCKKKLDEKEKSIQERLEVANKEAEMKMKEAEKLLNEVETIKSYEIELQQLRGLTKEQEQALRDMKEQQEQMKAAEVSLKEESKRLRKLIDMEKENLQHMQIVHKREISEKERTLQQTLHEKRIEIAMYWEERLMNECGRLKSEMEQIHNEEKYYAMETVRKQKEEEFYKAKQEWEAKINEYINEIADLKRELIEKDEYWNEEIVKSQTKTDRDILELRRLMDKIDMMHHEKFEKLVIEHDEELERINEESQKKINEIETQYENQVASLKSTLESVKEQMERDSQQKLETLIEQHRTELDSQWENLIQQKSEAIDLVRDEYVSKYNILEEQFLTQQKSHETREIELLKTIDSLKNELTSKESTIDDLQNNCVTLEGGIQVLNQEIAEKNEQILKNKKEAEHKFRGLQESITKLQEQHEKEKETMRLKLMSNQKQSQEVIDHLQRKCHCLTKLFEEVRLRYERRESRQEDLNTISDLKQVIAEQEKDLTCLNEEKRYFQMKLLQLEKRLVEENNVSGDEEEAFVDAEQTKSFLDDASNNGPSSSAMYFMSGPGTFSIPPTIPECDE